ncbi:MAG TPA: DNA ligase D [Gemmatimonadota bacterium]|nr:DNA ligase D [Gemmatimonadota bacterium]
MAERDPLRQYRAKRSPSGTPEPGMDATPPGPARDGAGGVFVIHQHAATRLHYDLRLEHAGVLLSWAVPKGPALDPSEKRLAVHVEDHPLEYASFEGVIPEGNYGAGAMILWDRGSWRPLEDPATGMEKGKLLFELRGHKLRGVWTLVRLAKSDKDEWLLIRERRYADGATGTIEDLPPESVFSGLTVEDLAEGRDPAPALRAEIERAGAPRRTVRVDQVRMMLAQPRRTPFSRPGWVFEPKLDGYRMLASKSPAGVVILTRNGNDATHGFPDLAEAVRALPFDELILDGEIVIQDERGLPSFQHLQRRALLRRRLDVERAARRLPATFYAFDLVAALGHDLRPLPLFERKRLLKQVLPPVGPLRYVDHFPERGEELYTGVVAMGLEGVVGKKEDSRYRGGRSGDWIKVRADQVEDFVVVGWTDPGGTRSGFGALHLAGWRDGELVYAGRVGTGFSGKDLEEIGARLRATARKTPPCTGAVPKGREHHWVEPREVCEVRYLEWTADGLLRQPVWLRMRPDKDPEDCELPRDARVPVSDDDEGEPDEELSEPVGEPLAEGSPLALVVTGAAPEVLLTNADKVFWPGEGITKGDLFAYYRTVGPWLLPYLRDRPLVLTRYPDGIEGTSFYQKNTPGHVPDWIRTVGIWSESSEREIEYVVCDDLPTLLYLVNLGTIPLHVWASRVASLDRPDWCILDLDPKEAPFENVVEVARSIHRLCKDIQLPAYVKTSGSTGLHVLVPLGGRVDYEMSRTLGELLGRLVVGELPEVATVERVISERGGKVYVDYLQNRRGQLLVAPFSVRPIPGAPVSTPLRWREVRRGLESSRHTIRTLPRRLSRLGEDPMLPLLGDRPDLEAALTRLHERLVASG